MRFYQFRQYSTLTLFFLVLLFSRCEDDPTREEFSRISPACFYITGSIVPLIEGEFPTTHKGTAFTFMNCSSTPNSTYKWTFGDGTTSDEHEPSHAYDKVGVYKVTLATYYENIISDTISYRVNVVHGEKMFKLAQKTIGIDIAESANGDVLLLGWRGENQETKYFVAALDSTLSVKYVKEYPYDQVQFLTSIEGTSDGNFILSGSHDNHWTALKIDPLGNILWQRALAETNGRNNYITETSDKGFITAGTIYININGTMSEYVEIVKLDDDGNIVWRRSYEEDQLKNTNNIIEVADGYTFASVKSDFFEDTLVLSKVNLNGELLWRTKMRYYAEGPVGYDAYGGSSLYSGDRYYVYSENSGPLFVLDQTGNVLTKKIIDPSRMNVATISDGNEIVFLDKMYSGANFNIMKIDESFNTVWTRNLGGVYNDPKYYPSSHYYVNLKIKELSSKDYIVLGTREDKGDPEYLSIYLIKIKKEGAIF